MTVRLSDDDLEAARERLASAIERFPLALKLLQRSLFRQYLALNVTSATPLLNVVSSVEGIDFEEAAWFISPPRGWPELALTTDARAFDKGVRRPFQFTATQIMRRHIQGGTIVRDLRRSTNVIGMRVLGDGIELTAVDGGLRIETYHGLGRILIDEPLPATVALALCGRPVGSVVEHRWLTGQPWRVLSVEEVEDRTEIVFDTGRVRWAMPWRSESAINQGDGK